MSVLEQLIIDKKIDNEELLFFDTFAHGPTEVWINSENV
jgi:hypothetical protein